MPIQLIDGSVFLHIPKTGGDWVASILKKEKLVTTSAYHRHFHAGEKHADFERSLYVGRHGTGRELLQTCGKKFLHKLRCGNTLEISKSVFRFCFVRHPLKWWESWWRFKKSRNWNPNGVPNDPTDWHVCTPLNGLGNDDFNSYMHNILLHRPGYVSELYGRFVWPGIAYIGQTENLCENLIEILQIRRLSFRKESIRKTDRANVSPSPAKTIEWDPHIKRKVILAEMPALIRYGYLTEEDCDTYNIPSSIRQTNLHLGHQTLNKEKMS